LLQAVGWRSYSEAGSLNIHADVPDVEEGVSIGVSSGLTCTSDEAEAMDEVKFFLSLY
jgi:hypothetical protein